jgi:hypothetical protein
MKPSKYNFFFPIDEKENNLAFNSLEESLKAYYLASLKKPGAAS